MCNQKTRTNLLTSLLVLTICSSAMAEEHLEPIQSTSIRFTKSVDFNIDQEEILEIKQAMQAAIDGEFLPGAVLLVGNSQGVGMLETVGTQGPGSKTPMSQDTIFRIYSCN